MSAQAESNMQASPVLLSKHPRAGARVYGDEKPDISSLYCYLHTHLSIQPTLKNPSPFHQHVHPALLCSYLRWEPNLTESGSCRSGGLLGVQVALIHCWFEGSSFGSSLILPPPPSPSAHLRGQGDVGLSSLQVPISLNVGLETIKMH